MNILKLIGRDKELFTEDILNHEGELRKIVSTSRFLVIGGAGSIGQLVTKEIFSRNPKKLHIIDLSENNLVELVRDIRCSLGYIDGDFQTFALDVNSVEYDAFIDADGMYDFVLNLSALKHVRSEKDPYTIMRMINVNIINTDKTIQQSIDKNVNKYFCASTDKATTPINIYGATKQIMEMFLIRKSSQINISSARFANVAFSNGSLLNGFIQRIKKRQPIVAPNDVKRYFITPEECGELCLMSTIFGGNRDIFFPKLRDKFHPISFSEIAIRYLEELGFEPYLCQTEDDARKLVHSLPEKGKWPCLFTTTNTTGEKVIEEFYTANQIFDLERFMNIGIIKNEPIKGFDQIDYFVKRINEIKNSGKWSKKELVDLFIEIIPDFTHSEKNKYLDDKM